MTKTAKTNFAFTFFDTQSKADFSDINIHKEALFTPELFSFAFNTIHIPILSLYYFEVSCLERLQILLGH